MRSGRAYFVTVPLPRHYHAPRLGPSFAVAVRRVLGAARRCTEPSKALEIGRFLLIFSALAGGAPDTIRTYDLGFRKALLYPTELRGRARGAP